MQLPICLRKSPVSYMCIYYFGSLGDSDWSVDNRYCVFDKDIFSGVLVDIIYVIWDSYISPLNILNITSKNTFHQ